MKQSSDPARLWVRRGFGVFLSVLTLWGFARTTGITWATQDIPADFWDEQLVEQALALQLGDVPDPDSLWDSLTFWEKLTLNLSPTLSTDQGLQAPDAPPLPTPSPSPPATLAPTPQVDGDDPETPPLLIPPDGTIVGKTMLPTNGSGYLNLEGIYVDNNTDLTLDVPALATLPLELDLETDAPQVLIVHTHGSEAYTPQGTDTYTPTDPYRTDDPTQSIMRVGAEVATVLTEMGLSVIQDTNLYDYPDYNGSYDRSLAAVTQYLTDYPSIQVVLDIHRDALADAQGTIYKPITTINGEECAQVMMVMGSNAQYTHPQWMENLAFAVSLQKEMNLLWPTLARPISLKENRYNQQLSPGSILVEIGSHGNTLEEALAGARMFARAAGAVLLRSST